MKEIGQQHDVNFYKILDNFISAVLNISLNGDIHHEINELYSSLECIDIDLFLSMEKSINKNLKKDVQRMLDFYYDNIEKHINSFEEYAAQNFLLQLLNMCKILKLKISY